MLAVGTWVAVLLIVFVFGVVALLFVVGMRQRLELEIPPRRVPEAPAPPKSALWLFVIGIVALLGIGLAGALTETRWLLFLGLGTYFACYVARIWIRVTQLRRWRRSIEQS